MTTTDEYEGFEDEDQFGGDSGRTIAPEPATGPVFNWRGVTAGPVMPVGSGGEHPALPPKKIGTS
jgi:hypothetical protein